MTKDNDPTQKRAYSPPALKEYGTMVALTKTGSGSYSGHYGDHKKKKKKKKYWGHDDD